MKELFAGINSTILSLWPDIRCQKGVLKDEQAFMFKFRNSTGNNITVSLQKNQLMTIRCAIITDGYAKSAALCIKAGQDHVLQLRSDDSWQPLSDDLSSQIRQTIRFIFLTFSTLDPDRDNHFQ